MIIYKAQEITVRKIELHDQLTLVTWLTDPRVLEFYGGRDRPHDLELVREQFYIEDHEMRCIVEYNNKPIGYIQYYQIDQIDRTEYGYFNYHEKIYGTDQFIGEAIYWNQGIGTKLVNSMIDFLVKHEKADKIIMDPQTWNKRAVACYTKCGFKIMKVLEKHEKHEEQMKDCYLMEYSIK
jgi:aminoglycoside 6'-N-acetyltransferase